MKRTFVVEPDAKTGTNFVVTMNDELLKIQWAKSQVEVFENVHYTDIASHLRVQFSQQLRNAVPDITVEEIEDVLEQFQALIVKK